MTFTNTAIQTLTQDDDWCNAFAFSAAISRSPLDAATSLDAFGLDDVSEVLAKIEGENDGPSWVCLGRLKDGRWFCLSACCDHTGWECQASGGAMVASTLTDLLKFCVTDDEAKRMEIENERSQACGDEPIFLDRSPKIGK